ncbi:phage tail protein [Pseudomonas sp. B392_1p]|uniref:phage tail protein n=1 Tax=Pseudomonas sp. B392_1p TaxID=3457507 RepID=UPI003FD5EB34
MANATSRFGGLLTHVGVDKQTQANAQGIPWKITRMQLGDAGGDPAQHPDPTPDPSQTALIHPVYTADLNALYPSPTDPGVLIAELVLPPEVGGFWIREGALFDADGAFVAVASLAPSYKPLLAQGSGRVQVIRMHILFGNIANVQLKIDPSVVLATRDYVDPLLGGKQPLDATLTALSKLATAVNQLIYSTGADQFALTELSAFARSLLDDADDAAARATLKAAPLASPALTGTPTAPTAAAGTNNTQIANTAFVRAAIAALVGSSPAALDTLNELAIALGNDPNFATTMMNALAGKLGVGATAAAATKLATAIIINGVSVNAGSNVTIGAPATAESVLAAIAAAPLGSVGTYGWCKVLSGVHEPGALVAGSNLEYATSEGNTASSPKPTGTWRVMGRFSGINTRSLVLRVA